MEKKEWEVLLDKANKDLKEHGAQLIMSEEDDGGYYALDIKYAGGHTENYASGYWENELNNLINDAWHEVKSRPAKPNAETLNLWEDMTGDNYHSEVRLAIAKYFGDSINPTNGYNFTEALKWINNCHNEVGSLELGVGQCRGLITTFMIKRIREVYGDDVADAVDDCL